MNYNVIYKIKKYKIVKEKKKKIMEIKDILSLIFCSEYE